MILKMFKIFKYVSITFISL